MSEVRAKLSFYRQSPRKVRASVSVLRGLTLAEAEAQLSLMAKRAAGPLLKLLRSAKANAEHNAKLQPEDLFVKEVLVNDGPTLKRWMPRAHGRATPIRKRTSHITIVLGDRDSADKKFSLKNKDNEESTKENKKPEKDKKKVLKFKKSNS